MSLSKEMISYTHRPKWINGLKSTGPRDRKWGYTIYRAYYGKESDKAWQTLLYYLRHQTKLAFGAYAKGALVEHNVNPDYIQRLKDLFSLDIREDPSLFDGIDIRGLRKFVKNEKEEQIEIVKRPQARPNRI
ncbi:hypothetical protein BFJ70_g15711 [Fusarium oxysporum]|jgi:hypothetical protein|nr:hypothetical protein BFJ70_g15711 [Fusarium oxysporum]